MSETATQGDAPTTAEIGPLESMNNQVAWDWYGRLRGRGDVVRDDGGEGWLISGYETLRRMWHDDQVVWQPPFVYDPEDPPFGTTREEWTEIIGPTDKAPSLLIGPDYDRVHRWWMRVFSPRVLAHWGDTLIEPIAHAQLDRIAPLGRVEFCSEYTDAITTRVMIAVLGLPWDDEEWIARFTEIHRGGFLGLLGYQGRGPAPRSQIDAALECVREIRAMLTPHVEARRSGEGTDFISRVWREAPELFGTDDYGPDDVMAHALAAFNGGSASTATQLAHALYLVLSQPGLQDEVLAAGEEGCARLGEESLRLYSTTEWRPRRAKEDTELAGVRIRRGERVIALGASGNTDERHHSCPYQVDLHRRAPRDHYGFGWGPRICPGQALARFQIERILGVTLERLRDLRLDPEAPQPQWLGSANRMWTPLHARFSPV
jgi:cytochrome P450